MPLDAFLAIVLEYDKDKWQPLVDSWKLSKNEAFKGLQQNFVNAIKGKNEINPYRPFKDWADYVLNRAEEDKDAAPLIDLVFHLTHPETLAGEFGKKRPDITGSNKGIKRHLLTWAQSLFSVEFKLERTPKDGEDEEVQQGSSKKVREVSKAKLGNSQTRNNSARSRSGLGSSGQSFLTQFGINAATSSTSEGKSASGSSSMQKRKPGKFSLSIDVSKSPHSSLHADRPENYLLQKIEDDDLTPNGATDPEVQLANYAMQMLSSKEFRTWTIGLLMDELGLQLWYYDRSHSFCTEQINLKDDGKSFAKIILAIALCSKDKEKLGFSNLYQTSLSGFSPPSSLRYIKAGLFTPVVDVYSEERLQNVPDENKIPKGFLEQGSHIRFDIDNAIHRQLSLFGRASRIEHVEVGKAEGGQFVLVPNPNNDSLVLKLSYQVRTRDREYDIIKLAREIDPVHSPTLLGYCEIDNLDLPGRQLENVPGISKPSPDGYEEKGIILLLMRYYENVYDLEGEAFVNVFRQGVCSMNHSSSGRRIELNLSQ